MIQVHRRGLLWFSILGLMMSVAFPLPLSFPVPKLILLDRDGVINEDVGAPGVVGIGQFQLTPNAASAIGEQKRRLRHDDGGGCCKVAVVTNQSCVGKGIITLQELKGIHGHMKGLLLKYDPDAALDRIYMCTSTDVNHPDRKPNPGMMLQAMQDFGVKASECVMVGDTVADLQAAAAAGIEFRILVSTGYGTSIMGDSGSRAAAIKSLPKSIFPFHYVKDLAAAVDLILTRSKGDDARQVQADDVEL